MKSNINKKHKEIDYLKIRALLLAAFIFCIIIGIVQGQPDRFFVQPSFGGYIERNIPQAQPEITGFSPSNPELGGNYVASDGEFVIYGANFSPDVSKNKIGIRTYVEENPQIPPSSQDFIAEVSPTTASPEELHAVMPSNVPSDQDYLTWVYVEGGGHSNPIKVRYVGIPRTPFGGPVPAGSEDFTGPPVPGPALTNYYNDLAPADWCWTTTPNKETNTLDINFYGVIKNVGKNQMTQSDLQGYYVIGAIIPGSFASDTGPVTLDPEEDPEHPLLAMSPGSFWVLPTPKTMPFGLNMGYDSIHVEVNAKGDQNPINNKQVYYGSMYNCPIHPLTQKPDCTGSFITNELSGKHCDRWKP
jgi:hypothetical protein